MNHELSILIPALNEADNIGQLISRLTERLKSLTPSFEILVIDGGSKDNTRAVAKDAGARVIVQKTKGYGAAFKEALSNCSGAYIITMDADFSHDPYFVQDMWNNRLKADMIIASRYVPCGISDAPLSRRILSKILNTVFAFFIKMPVKDYSSGFRMYRRDRLNELSIQSNDYNILEEVLIRYYCDGNTVL
ncbi:MAG: glycosyltransferase, partial [Elusimicrobia bacterium]|nr:glycosyltransferase [Elusimicrobiota bacterium]